MEKIRILAVDDEPDNLTLIERAFNIEHKADVIKAGNGREAIDLLKLYPDTDIVLLDLNMPIMDGFKTLELIKHDENFKLIPVIVITGDSEERIKALQLGANDFLDKPYNITELKLRALTYIRVKKYNDILKTMNQTLEEKVKERTLQLQNALKSAKETEYEICLRLGKTAEFRDMETGAHIVRMSYYSQKLAELYGLSHPECELLLYASPLHDVGKIGIPDRILLKPGKLTEEEFEVMKTHTTIGGKILDKSDKYDTIRAGQIIAMEHHEKWDGTGYPNALKGDNIHIYGRIVAIADVFDALSSKRVYKSAFPLEETLSIMKNMRGRHFEPELLDLFLGNIDHFLKLRTDIPDQEQV
ncbi:MAG: response regulator [Planctomycetes bacterium]|nr:response regulator [Planctomycetota bacterium]